MELAIPNSNPAVPKLFSYAARTLAVLTTAFFAIFILEGFGPDFTWTDSLMHLLVALVYLGVTVLAFRHPKAGGLSFLVLGTCWLGAVGLNASGASVGGVQVLAGALFLASRPSRSAAA